MADRKHQADLRVILSRFDESQIPCRILCFVVPGGGKSFIAGILGKRFPQLKIAWFVPRLSLQSQAIESMQRNFGIILRDSGNDVDPSRGTRGFVATHCALSQNPELWRHELARNRYILIIDEHHHAKIGKDGSMFPVSRAIARLNAPITAYLTGTLDTNDGTLIHGMEYEQSEDGRIICPERSADIFIRYDRATALLEKAIVPIEFHRHDGPIKWQSNNGETKEDRLSEVSRKDESAAVFTALRTEVADQLFSSGVAHWKANANGGKLIVVLDRQETAKRYAAKLSAMGITVALAIDDNPEAQNAIRKFRNENVSALATCQMAYEGLDVPSASHLICLTHIRSAPWIEQMLARVWRALPGKKQCWAFVPDDPRMNRVIEKIARDQPDAIKDKIGGGGGGGGGEQSILALGGEVDEINRSFLDQQFACDETRSRVVDALKGLGLQGDEPEVEALVAKIKASSMPPAFSRTPKEQEIDLRKQIADQCKTIDRDIANRRNERPSWGDTQKRLFGLTGKSITEMSIEELKRAHTKLQGLRP